LLLQVEADITGLQHLSGRSSSGAASARRLPAALCGQTLLVQLVNVLFVCPPAWLHPVALSAHGAPLLADYLVSLAAAHNRSVGASPDLVAALGVAVRVLTEADPPAAPEFKDTLLTLLTIPTMSANAAAEAAPPAAAADAGSRAVAASEAVAAAGAEPGAKSSAAGPPLHLVNLLQTLDEQVKTCADELFWLLAGEDPRRLIAAVSFPLAAGILQAKGALDLPEGS
jgi:hypothetical protein